MFKHRTGHSPVPQHKLVDAKSRGARLLTQPVFLVGAEHSGTSVMGVLLNHHPKISFVFDFHYAVDMMPEGGGWPHLGDYHQYLGANPHFDDAKLVVASGLDYPRLVDSFLRQRHRRDRKPLVAASVHRHFDRLLRIWPDARFIHLVRDGRAVAWSMMELGEAGNSYIAAESWLEAENLWAKVRRLLPEDRFLEVGYEELITRPQPTLARVCQFLEIPYAAAMLANYRDIYSKMPACTWLNRWKRMLLVPDIQLAEACIGDQLVERGYQLSGHPPVEITPAMLKRMRRQSRSYRAEFRWRKHGTVLWLAELISRRLGPRSWRLRVLKRMSSQEAVFLSGKTETTPIRRVEPRRASALHLPLARENPGNASPPSSPSSSWMMTDQSQPV